MSASVPLSPTLPSLAAWLPGLVLAAGWLAMFLPSYLGLASTIWASDAQGHGPIILAVGLWLLWRKLPALQVLAARPAPWAAAPVLCIGLAAYVLGRSQTIWSLEIAAQIAVLAALLLAFYGPRGLRTAAFPLAFLVFMIPWPGDWVDAVTQPLKSAVSAVAATLLYEAGYPVGRSGVILTVGPYQLLVADACAGLNSLFTLEALGLLYMNLMRYQSLVRNVVLALLIVPISFAANVVRVVVLVLVTYHFGDAAGQGFVHSFAGMLLFIVALLLILAVDAGVGLVLPGKRRDGR